MIKKMDVWHCLIVYKDTVTPIAKKVVEESKDIIIELFNVEELQYNITKHYLVPKHELLFKKKSKECEQFKKKYSDKFPIILKSDPVSRFYGYEKGDIIKITRNNGYITYRIVR
jgi:DNA-directed RNA polymerase I, II, and III subunit RPABC1